MSPLVIVIIVVAILISIGMLVMAFGFPNGGAQEGASIRNLVSNQRAAEGTAAGKGGRGPTSVFGVHKVDGQLTQKKHFGEGEELERRLKCAQWNIMPLTFRCMQLAAGFSLALIFFVFGFGLKVLWIPFGFAFGFFMVNSILQYKIQKRFKNFDSDYPNFLLSLVGLLKTGMNPMQAIESAVQNLDDSSLLKLEVRLMIERLRFGVQEERSIGSFGENIDHPEIELFVQALLLSRRLGGTLSDTLERLAKQVRKRQFFRNSAAASVALQRGSVWVIIGILVGLLAYILLVYPPLVMEGFNIPVGKAVWQVGIMLMITGIWWVRQVTKIRI